MPDQEPLSQQSRLGPAPTNACIGKKQKKTLVMILVMGSYQDTPLLAPDQNTHKLFFAKQ